jgi:hypothetical protein
MIVRPRSRRIAGSAAILAAVILSACGGPGGSPSGAPATPTPAASAAGVVVTIRVEGGETYRVRLVEPADVEIAQDLLAGRRSNLIPNGRIVRGSTDVNTGYNWHIDPNDFEWAEVTVEVCDGLPSYVTDGSLSGDRYCPWSATVVDIEG